MFRSLSMRYRYLAVNYESQTFSVSQAKFEEDLPAQIVAHPSVKTITEPRRGKIIGASVGTATGLTALIFILIIATRKGRSTASGNSKSSKIAFPELPNGLKTPNSIHEIDNYSLYWGYREIMGTEKAELLDEKWPSGSGKIIQEMPPHSPAPAMYELMTSRHFLGSSMIRSPNSLNRFAVFASTGTLREGRTSSDTKKEPSRVVSLSPRHVSSQRRSFRPRWLKVDRPLPSPSRGQPLDLNRSLPTTPISESPQISPAITSFSSRFTIRDYLSTSSNRTSVALSIIGDIQNFPRTLITRPAEVRDRRQRSNLSDSFMETEIMIPPGSFGPSTSASTSDSQGDGRRNLGSFF